MDNLPPRPPSFVDQRRRNSVSVAQIPPGLASATPEKLVRLLYVDKRRDDVLLQLNNVIKQKPEMCNDIALLLWDSFNIVYILLQEVISVYRKFTTSTLTMEESARVCNALGLFQCMASHPDARMGLIKANIPFYIYPFLKTSAIEKPLEFLRLSSLGLIESLAKFDDPYGPEILNFFLGSELFPLCLHCMDHGDELTRKVATLIVMKILMRQEGLDYCCALIERVVAVAQVLCRLVQKISERPCLQTLKYAVQCYLRLSQVSWSRGVYDALKYNFPRQLIDNTFHFIFGEDPEIVNMLQQTLVNISWRG